MTKSEALELSIKKWQEIVNGTGIDMGVLNCELCYKYYTPVDVSTLQKARCAKECPVRKNAGDQYCNNTPYVEWSVHQRIRHEREDVKQVQCETCKVLAQKELDYLISLRKKEEVEK